MLILVMVLLTFQNSIFNGGFNLENAKFGDGDRNFSDTTINGDFNTLKTHFGNGLICFNQAKIMKSILNLSHSILGDNHLILDSANCVKGVDISGQILANGSSFKGLVIKEGVFNAYCTQFSDGNISFKQSQFNGGKVDFSQVQFGEGDVCFDQVTFAKGVSFEKARFKQGDRSFNNLTVADGKFIANDAFFHNGNTSFTNAKFLQGLSFKKASLSEGGFTIRACEVVGADFSDTSFDRCHVVIERCSFTRNVQFNNAKTKNILLTLTEFNVKTLDFSDATIGGGSIVLYKDKTQVETMSFQSTTMSNTEINAFRWQCDKVDISFASSKMVECELNFRRAKLKGDTISFRHSILENSTIRFSQAQLNYMDISFHDVILDNSEVHFLESQIKLDSEATSLQFDVSEANIDNSKILFNGAIFDCDVSFKNMIIKEQTQIDCTSAIFEREASFEEAQINASSMNFYKTCFEKAYVDFRKIDIPEASLNFEYTYFGSNVSFAEATNTETTKNLSFKFASFEGSFDLTDLQFGCVVDLTHTKFTNQVALDGVRCSLPRQRKGFKLEAKERQDTGRLRRLKEIAENNKDHQQALHFHADEMRAKRWNEHNTWQSMLDVGFDIASNYGQSILKPFTCLAAMFVLLVSVFSFGAPVVNADDERSLWDKLPISHASNVVLSNSVPFLTTSKSSKEKSMQVVFGYKPAGWVYVVLTIHTGFSLVFLFLMGLGFRNRFRI